jgi:hypothetical protein
MTARSPRRAVLAHNARLDILCCLDSEEPLVIQQVGARAGLDDRLTAYHLRILDRFRLAGRKRQLGEAGPTGYVLRLGKQPDWVIKTVEAHRKQ